MIPDEIEAFVGESAIVQVQGKFFSSAYLLFESSMEKIPASLEGDEAVVRLNVTKSTPSEAIFVLVSENDIEEKRPIFFNIQIRPKAPMFTERLHETAVEEGDLLELNVEFIGHPKPVVEWTFNGEILDQTGSKLSIPNAKTINAGKYAAKISNDLGTEKSQAIVEVMKKSLPPKFLNSPNDGEFDENSSFELACFVGGHPNPKSIKFIACL